ncbi:F-type H+-transporting ATPase subunit b [Novosphingobium sp. CF614]|uniref:F0F1 ATP synthase subunit B family protein n=1 Tax=Novosphingobium sp. CF614 TaxID=1884364 RepID=UPI0008E51A61|nr:ATPase [Novosphingobium sp. CF614]SFG33133.1 F-type H+-transporting ATPase subunit b [Novosphingobium sp. CF614]
MPQIAQLGETYASQIFWILLIFGFVFFVIGNGMVPKVMATVALRDKQIGNDLAAAEAARKAADAEEEAWRKRENENRAQAQAIIAGAKTQAARVTEGRLAEVAVKLDAQLAEADARIAAARDGALNEIETVATEAASDIVARIAGVTVDEAAARAAVKEALHG